MRIPRIFVPASLLPGVEFELPDQAHRHLAQVLKLSQGHQLHLFNGQGGEYAAEIVASSRRQTIVKILSHLVIDRETSIVITLAQCVSKGPRMDFVMQKATELGVSVIQPVISKQGAVKLDAQRMQKKQSHWQGVVHSACEQSGRNVIPEVRAVLNFEAFLQNLPKVDICLFLDPLADKGFSELPVEPPSAVLLIIGPEGGFATQEIEQLKMAGFQGLKMGPRVLRTETAALVALSACQLRWGDLSNSL